MCLCVCTHARVHICTSFMRSEPVLSLYPLSCRYRTQAWKQGPLPLIHLASPISVVGFFFTGAGGHPGFQRQKDCKFKARRGYNYVLRSYLKKNPVPTEPSHWPSCPFLTGSLVVSKDTLEINIHIFIVPFIMR